MSDLKKDIAPSPPFNGLHALQPATPFFAIRNRPHRYVISGKSEASRSFSNGSAAWHDDCNRAHLVHINAITLPRAVEPPHVPNTEEALIPPQLVPHLFSG